MNKKEQAEQEEARAKLREILKPGDRVYTILRHTSASGMSRSISLFITEGGDHLDITYWAARAMGDKIDQNHGGIKVGGCGMDMGFSLVYNLGYCLFPEGFKVDGRGRNGDESGWDKDGGYALRQIWL